jgi:alpha-L-fucosidase 2
LFSTHPPFQIDGNYGLMAGVAEMVVQSHTGTLDLLPALPAQWAEGEARDLRCRGGLAVDFAWNEGELAGATVRRHAGDSRELVRIRCLGRTTELLLPVGHQVELDALLRPRGEPVPC